MRSISASPSRTPDAASPPEQYDYVFERFTKLDTFSQGNGLGLYLCRLIVGHLGGEIQIDPDYTGGTRVVATLPRK